MQLNGIMISDSGFYMRSGSLTNVASNTTGSTSMSFDCGALKLKRVEVFSSGSAATFDLAITSTQFVNLTSSYDPRMTIAYYQGIPGGADYSGIDQVEAIDCITNDGLVWLSVIPKNPVGTTSFIYMLFFESSLLIID